MTSMGRILRVPTLAAVGLLLVVGAVQAGSDPVLNCQADKVTAAGIRAACLAGEQAKALQGGKSNPGSCEVAFDAALAKADKDAAKKGATCRYIDNQDGTIGDLNTLLMWEKKDAPKSGTGHDSDVLYAWAPALAWATSLGLTEANDTITMSGSFAGHTDWRLPTISELRTILDIGIGNCAAATHDGNPPCIDPIFRNGVDSFTAPGGYWSATTFIEHPESAWMIDFGNGVVNQFNKVPNDSDPQSGIRYVRAVRGGR
jgi:hypothetical protein